MAKDSDADDAVSTPRSESPGEAAAEGAATDEPTLLAKIWEQVHTLLFAVAIALVIRAVVIEPFRIPSGSMLPTLLIGDHLFVNKFIYGARIPFTDYRLPALRDPERGDVVVFEVARGFDRGPRIFPADERPELPRDDFVKRIVGMPGDEIEVDDGQIYINGERMIQKATGDVFTNEVGARLDVYAEMLESCEHATLDDTRMVGPELRRFVVPAGRYLMIGDNRDHSNDGRNWGTVHRNDFKGPAFILYWSWNVEGNFLQFFNPLNWWNAEKRWSRIFQRVKCGPVPSPPA